ncbi:hypothetical protein SAMN04487859_10477 [Roseovarius lutimaris]|uniref:Uncharacterized protein n=1 Tax=Roseovarius lutimaris TaxID=1005928 RepID=A0A1I4ZT62_9RHOB|nr:hypothetical protein [Roseovarius lutimaris]SFN53190.1 hypothetical protein SAMN04487859_10477 [Roseovarius lutimaris]
MNNFCEKEAFFTQNTSPKTFKRVRMLVCTGIFALILPASLMACPAKPPTDFTDFIESEIPTGPVGDSAEVDIQINGLVANGSAAGDSCGAAILLPEGMTAIAVRAINEETGKPAGFEEFRLDARASRNFCGGKVKGCVAFVAKVGKSGLKEGTPIRLVVETLAENLRRPGDTAQLAGRVARDAVVMLGGADAKHQPYHHLSVFRLPGLRVTLSDSRK